MTIRDAVAYAQGRWPGLSLGDYQSLAALAGSAAFAGQGFGAGDPLQPQNLASVPVNPFVDDGDMAGSREQIAVEITPMDDQGVAGTPYLIIVNATGTETPQELLTMAVADLCRRAADTPGSFPGVDCTGVFVFDYEFLSAIRAF
jgi:hypothetical protein